MTPDCPTVNSSVPDQPALKHDSALGLQQLADRQTLSSSDAEAVEQLAFQHGKAPESYDVAISPGQVLRSNCGQAAVAVLADRRCIHIPGGLLAPECLKPALASSLADFSQQHGLLTAVYSLGRQDAALLHDAGFIVNKFGEEPLIRLHDLTWSGKKFQWVRQQTNLAMKIGLTVREIDTDGMTDDLARSLQQIVIDDLRGRTYNQPLKLLEGHFDPWQLKRRRLFIAEHPSSGTEAFLACSPMNNGQRWAFETYRRRKQAPKGCMPFLFRSVIDRMHAEGIDEVSLCLIPGRNVRTGNFDHYDPKLTDRLDFWYRRLGFLLNAAGLDHFKSRFRPEYEDRFLCVTPRNSIRSMVSFLKVSGALRPHPVNMLRQCLRQFHPVAR